MRQLEKKTELEKDPCDVILDRLFKLQRECRQMGYQEEDPFMQGIEAAMVVVGQVQTEELIKEQLTNARIQREGKKVRR
jgi:hypothetical protein